MALSSTMRWVRWSTSKFDTHTDVSDHTDDFSSPGQVNSFGFAASPINFIAGGKRPQSSIASSIAEDLVTGDVTIATGSAGGSRSRQSIFAQVADLG